MELGNAGCLTAAEQLREAQMLITEAVTHILGPQDALMYALWASSPWNSKSRRPGLDQQFSSQHKLEKVSVGRASSLFSPFFQSLRYLKLLKSSVLSSSYTK